MKQNTEIIWSNIWWRRWRLLIEDFSITFSFKITILYITKREKFSFTLFYFKMVLTLIFKISSIVLIYKNKTPNWRFLVYLNKWWRMRGSNPRPLPCKGNALPTELILHGDPSGTRTHACMDENHMCWPLHHRAKWRRLLGLNQRPTG